MDLQSLQFAAKYPFTPTAKEFLRAERSIDWSVMERAAQRVADAQKGEISYIETNDRQLLEREILSFPIAKAIASLCTRTNAARWIAGEVKRAIKLLRSNNADVQKFAQQFELHISGYTVDVKSYLKYIPKEHAGRLVVQNVRAGHIILDENRIFEVLAEVVSSAIQQGFPVPQQKIPTSILQDVKDFANKISSRFKEYAREIRAFGEFAPCMAQIIRALENGDKVSHIARWTVATYLLRRNVSEERVVELFKATPNFNEKRTRYHIEHIKRKGYTVPSCEVIDSYGLCIAKCGIKSPLQYWGKK